jgi:hypothetical protein
MGKFYENLETLMDLVKKIDKKDRLAEFILSCITIAKDNPEKSQHEIIKMAKKKWG